MKVLINESYFPNELICCSSITGSIDMCILKLKKKHNLGTKSLFLNFQNSFLASYFPICQKPIDQNSSLTPFWNNN